MSNNNIKCPNCGTSIDIDEVLSHQAEERMLEKMKQKEIELQIREREFEDKRIKAQEEYKQRLDVDRQKISKEEADKATQKANEAFQLQFKTQQEELENRKRENTILKEKELAFLKREDTLREKEQELELQVQRQLKAEREAMEQRIFKQEQDKNELRFKEYEKKIEQTQKALDEAQRKATQGSMQLQGEVQELALEALLKEAFPFDMIEEVGKGVKGADCIQTVRNNFGQLCGKIIYESKRTQAFSNDWIEKLKADMRATNADIAVIVTQTMPKDMVQFGEKNGIWICTYPEVRALAHVLRSLILRVFSVSKSQENKGDKMHLLYDYFTNNEFAEQWRAVREGFLSMKQSIDAERTAMEKLWKAREKQLEKILLNAAHISGSIEGIAGLENIDMKLLDE